MRCGALEPHASPSVAERRSGRTDCVDADGCDMRYSGLGDMGGSEAVGTVLFVRKKTFY